MLSSGSIVRRGEGNGVVMLTGAKTYFGRTTELAQYGRLDDPTGTDIILWNGPQQV